MTKSEQMAVKLGEKIAIVGQARLLIDDQQKPEVAALGLHKFRIAGAVLSDLPIPEIDGNFSMLECDIIIVPKAIHKEAKNSALKGGTVAQAMVMGYQDENNWANHIKL